MNANNLDARLASLAALLEDARALSPVALKLSGENTIADAMIVATATSRRQAQGLAEAVVDWCKKNGQEYLHTEGFDTGEWILVDANDIIVHIFLPDSREMYRIEDLAARAPKKENRQ
ncbi:MAG: ribosome silencing factor [Desulfovibrio sp.]|nr:ribosome silencing factor [Desulfovibrio sp.]